MSSKKLKHVIFEMWIHMIEKISVMLANAKATFPPGCSFCSVNLDGYTNKLSGRMFIGVSDTTILLLLFNQIQIGSNLLCYIGRNRI